MVEHVLIGVSTGFYILYIFKCRKTKEQKLLDKVWNAHELDMSRPKIKKAEYGFHFIYKMLPDMSVKDFIKLQDKLNDFTGYNTEIYAEYGWLHIRLITKPLPSSFNFEKMDIKGVPIGKGYNKFYTLRFDQLHHVLVGGLTRYGKTSLLRLMITCLLMENKNDVHLIDLKRVDFPIFKQWAEVALEEKHALAMVKEINRELDRRLEMFERAGIQKIEQYSGELRRIILFVDEYAQLGHLPEIDRISRLGAGMGIHLVLATQHPAAAEKITPTKLKQNLLARIGFKCADPYSSRMILGNTMAYELPAIPGRAIYFDGTKYSEVQVPFLDVDDVNKLLSNTMLKPCIELLPDTDFYVY